MSECNDQWIGDFDEPVAVTNVWPTTSEEMVILPLPMTDGPKALHQMLSTVDMQELQPVQQQLTQLEVHAASGSAGVSADEFELKFNTMDTLQLVPTIGDNNEQLAKPVVSINSFLFILLK